MSASPVRVAIADGVGTIALSRPDAHNAMDQALIEALTGCIETVTGDASVRAILIEAEGKHFCVGGDINRLGALHHAADLIETLARRLHVGIEKLATHPVPVVIAVQGAAAGAGLSLAAAGDIVLAARSAQFAIAYPGIGLTADGGATWTLPRLIGLRRTQELAYLGTHLDAEEALACGLVTRVVEDGQLAGEARALARQLANGPTAAFGGIKRLLMASGRASLHNQLEAEAISIATAMASPDGHEGVTAFLEHRPPHFTGK